jgi:hypothetical protein
MDLISNLETVATLVLIIWSIVLVWASWQIHVMTRAMRAERAAVRRWVRIKGLWERQNGGRR